MRALSFARAASRRWHHTTIISNSPWAEAIRQQSAWPEHTALRALATSLDKHGVRARVTELLETEPHDALVVDTFPRGLAGELPALTARQRVPRVWVHRDMTPEYANRAEVIEAASSYDLALAPGEAGPLAERVGARSTAPWLALDREALLPRERAREALGAGAQPLALVLGSPSPEEDEQAAQLTKDLASRKRIGWSVRFASLGDATAEPELRAPKMWPLMKLYAGVDALIGAGGYNTVHEARATGVPLLATARTRLYDRQSQRLRTGERFELAELQQRLERVPARRDTICPFDNGAHEAVRLVARLLEPEALDRR